MKRLLQNFQATRAARMAYWKSVRGASLVIFYAAVFTLFCCVGLIGLLMQSTEVRPLQVLIIALLSGGFAVVYAVMAIKRKFIFFPLFMLAQGGLTVLLSRIYGNAKALIDTHSAMHHQLLVLGVCATIALALGYILFLVFFSREGIRYFRAQTEFELAAEIHRALVPPIHRSIGGFEIYGASLPSGQVGGDLVDVTEARNGWMGYVADVSGHGVSSGVLMAMFKTAVRSRSDTDPSSAVLLEGINRTLFPLKTPNMYVTAAFLEWTENEELSASLAGHPPLLHYSKCSGAVSEVSAQNLALGVVPSASFSSDHLSCAPGDIFVLLTDGLTEVFDDKGNELGMEPIKSALCQHAEEPLPQLFQQLRQVATNYGRQQDDQTILLVRRAG